MDEKDITIEAENSGVENYFITLAQASEICGYTPEHLNLLCRKGVLRGKKFGRNWETTREWLNEFLFLPAARKRKAYRRRKTKKPVPLAEARLQKNELEDTQGEQSIASLVSLKEARPEEKEIRSGGLIAENIQEEKSVEKKNKPRTFLRDAVIDGKVRDKSTWPKAVLTFSFAIFISFFIFLSFSYYQYVETQKYVALKNIPEDISEDAFLSESENGIVEGVEKVNGEETGGSAAIASSENFKLKEISFGGVLLASANGENLEPSITDVKSDVFGTKDGKQAQVLISWKTNKLAKSEIGYSKSGGSSDKELQENGYGFNHSVVLTKLDLGTTYVYQIGAKDRWGNAITTERFGIYTGSKMVSVFDLILKAVNETFSWAFKKN